MAELNITLMASFSNHYCTLPNAKCFCGLGHDFGKKKLFVVSCVAAGGTCNHM